MNGHTKKIFDETDWDALKNAKVLAIKPTERILATLDIRGISYELMDYDWYMITAIIMTDGFNEIDSSYVFSFRNSVREDVQKFNSEFLDMLHSYEYYSLASLDKYIEIFDQYSEILASHSKDEAFQKWFRKKQNELEKILEKISKNKV